MPPACAQISLCFATLSLSLEPLHRVAIANFGNGAGTHVRPPSIDGAAAIAKGTSGEKRSNDTHASTTDPAGLALSQGQRQGGQALLHW
jgi:hypothetical protein